MIIMVPRSECQVHLEGGCNFQVLALLSGKIRSLTHRMPARRSKMYWPERRYLVVRVSYCDLKQPLGHEPLGKHHLHDLRAHAVADDPQWL